MALGLLDREWIRERALAAGFDVAGVAAVPDSTTREQASARFAEWIAAGYAGEMEWLKRNDPAGNLVRGDVRRSMPWARSVIVCAANYNSDAPGSTDPAPAGTGWIARYAWTGHTTEAGEARGSDYHDVLLPRLSRIESELCTRFGPELNTRCYVDTGPVQERDFAVRAGMGWIGKNACLINQGIGSWLLLGVIVTSLELQPEGLAVQAMDRCGSCTRCIDACPTDALIAPRTLDATRCISYLTIEKKGAIPEDLRAPMGRQVFGCDICQDVCPWNRRAPVADSGLLPARQQLVNPSLDWLAAMDGPEFNRWFRGSPLERTRRKRLLRNVAVAMGNSGDQAHLPRLREWSMSDDPALAEVARWAIVRLGTGSQPNESGTESPPPASVQ